MSFSTYLEGKILNWIKGSNMPSAPGNAYCGLFNGDPGDSGTGGTEVTTTIRVAGRRAVSFGAISGHTIVNNSTCDFGTAAGGATVTHFGIFDSVSGGNLLMSGALSISVTVIAGNAVSFASGALSLSVD